jgi:hypothetical protein
MDPHHMCTLDTYVSDEASHPVIKGINFFFGFSLWEYNKTLNPVIGCKAILV